MRQAVFFLLLLILSLAGIGQTTQYLGAPNTTVLIRGPFGVAVRDTTFTPIQKGIQVFREADSSLYVSVAITGRKWSRVGSGASSGVSGDYLTDVTISPSQYVDTIFQVKNSVASIVGFFYKPRGCEDSEGGIVVHRTGLTFDLTAWPLFCVNGRYYSFAGGSVTLPAADPDFPKYVAIYIDTLGNAGYLEGIAAASPAQPQVDESYQRMRTYVFIAAGATEPSDINTDLVYDENDEAWYKTTVGNIEVDTASTAQAVSGTESIQTTAYSNDYLYFHFPGTKNISDYLNLNFWLRVAGLSGNQAIRVQLYLDNAPASTQETVTLNKVTTGWQLISQAFTKFSYYTKTFNRIRFMFAGTGTFPVYLDNIRLQGGVTPAPGSGGSGTPAKGITVNVGGTLVQVPDGGSIEFAAGDDRINIGLTGNPPKLTFTVNSFPVPIDSVEGLRDEMGTFVTDLFSRNDSLIGIRGGEEFFVDTVRLFYWDEDFFEGDGTPENRLRPKSLDSTGTPINFLYQDTNNKIRKASLSGLGGGGGQAGH